MRREIATVVAAALTALLAFAPSPAFADQKAASNNGVPESTVPINVLMLRPPYLEDSLSSRNWDFGGDTVMEVNKFIRLTADVQSQAGWLWSKVPMTSNSWIIEFQFKVAHEGTLSGDGFAFWYTKGRAEEGPVFGNKDNFEGLGVFFDTYANSRIRHSFPYIMAMIGDGKTPYDHDFDGSAAEAGGCHAEFRNRDYPTRARVKYVQNNYVLVEIDVEGENKWRECFRVNDVSLPPLGYIGFTGLTGGVYSMQDIIDVSANAVLNGPERQTHHQPPQNHDQTSSSSSGHSSQNQHAKTHSYSSSHSGSGYSVTFIVIVLIVIGVIGYVGWTVYRTNKSHSYKRF